MSDGYILVTGGAGFIGSHIARELIRNGRMVAVIDNLSNGSMDNIPPEAEFIQADLRRPESLNALDGTACQAVYHLAAQSSGALSFLDPLADLESHALATFHLLQWCRKHGVPRFLYASSTTTYGDPQYLPLDEKHPQNPKSYYAAGKMATEGYVRLFNTLGLKTTIFRMPNVYGPGQNLKNKDQGMVSIYLSYILENKSIEVKGVFERFRDFIYIDDVVSGFVTALENPAAFGETFNLVSGHKATVREILDGLIAAFGLTGYPIEQLPGTPGDQFGVVCDNTKIMGRLGWRPGTTLEDGLKKTVDYERRKSAHA